MCGIAAILNIRKQTPELREKALAMARKIRHRGPDWSGIYCGGSAILAHERLSIVDPQSGGQPLYSPDKKVVLAVNGEIYNHREIRKEYAGKYDFQTGSDCEVILALYKEYGIHFLEKLNGIFAFVLYDSEKDEFLIARDPIGVIPLYIGYDSDGKVYCASELKALEGFCERYEPFLPGHCYYSKDGKMTRWYVRDWTQYEAVADAPASVSVLREGLEKAVREQLMSDVPHSIYEIEGARSCAVEFRSFSKTAGFTGVRCGYTVVPEEVKAMTASGEQVALNHLWNRRQCTKFNGTSYITQRGAEAIYTAEGQAEIKETIAYYMENARLMREGLHAAGFTLYGGVNAPYIWVKAPEGLDSWSFFEMLLHEVNVVGTPGVGFGPSGEGFLRLTAFGKREDCQEAMNRIKNWAGR